MEPFASGDDILDKSPEMPSIEWFDGEPQFRFFVTGPSTAGKTVFLASLHHSLAVPGDGNRYYARLMAENQTAALLAKVASLMNPKADWPPSDAVANEYIFRCFHNATRVRSSFPLFRFQYMDFPGRDMTNPTKAKMLNVQHAIDLAHTVVFLLDGKKILDGLQKRKTNDRTIYEDLDNIAVFANSCIFRPTQFVITKWDILKGYQLEAVRRFLFRSNRFAAIIRDRRSALKPTYLIPVSAVGNNFALYDAKTNSITKRADASFEPYNLDVCLAIAITDTLVNKFKTKATKGELLWFSILKACVGTSAAARWIGSKGQMILREGWMASMLRAIEEVGDTAHEDAELARRAVEARLARIKDRNSALDSIVEVQKLLVNGFLRGYPAADLLVDLEQSR
jgi:hypothetical protein